MRAFVGIAVLLGTGCNSQRTSQTDERFGVTSQALIVADCPAGYNVIQGTSGNDTLNGTSGNDCIISLGGSDTIHGNGGNDYIAGRKRQHPRRLGRTDDFRQP